MSKMNEAERIEELEALNKALSEKVSRYVELLDEQYGTPCEQIRHQQQVEDLETENAKLEAKLSKAVEALEECEDDIDAYIQFQYPQNHMFREIYRQRDYAKNPARVALAELKTEEPNDQ